MNRQFVPWVESPLHDRDLYDDKLDAGELHDGDFKKPHIHLLIMFDTVKEEKQLLDAYSFLNIKHFKKCNSTRGSYHYFWHNPDLFPDKAVYDRNQIILHCGADLVDLLQPSAGDVNRIYFDILKWIDLNGIQEISTVQRYAFFNDLQDWIYVLNRKSMLLYQYLSSVRSLKGSIEGITYDADCKLEHDKECLHVF